jgi:predicted small secreted protein
MKLHRLLPALVLALALLALVSACGGKGGGY